MARYTRSTRSARKNADMDVLVKSIRQLVAEVEETFGEPQNSAEAVAMARFRRKQLESLEAVEAVVEPAPVAPVEPAVARRGRYSRQATPVEDTAVASLRRALRQAEQEAKQEEAAVARRGRFTRQTSAVDDMETPAVARRRFARSHDADDMAKARRRASIRRAIREAEAAASEPEVLTAPVASRRRRF